MFRTFLLRFLPLVLTFAVSSILAQAKDNLDEQKALEIQVLENISGSERKAKRMHRTIERYRGYQKRVLDKMTQNENSKPYTGSLRTILAYSNMLGDYPPNEVRVLTKLTGGFLDVNEYLDTVKAGKTYVPPYIEELVVIGSIFDHMPMDPAEFSIVDIRQMRTERRYANQLYRDGYYDEAYPILLDLAKRGFKDSQSRLAYILLNGTETVEKSNLRALGWLGSAAYGDTEPQFRVLFKRYMDEVPEYVKPTVEAIVDGYQKSFAHDEHQNCSTDHKYTKLTRIKKTFCRFELEAIVEACEIGFGGGKCWAHAVNTQ